MKKTLITCILLVLIIGFAHAEEFCVGTASELRNALVEAANNSEHDEIRIEIGLYESNGSVFEYDESGGYDLKISGDWMDFIENDCGIQAQNGPKNTILDGSGLTRALNIILTTPASLEISDLTLRDGYDPNDGGGLKVWKNGGYNTGEIKITDNIFITNVSHTDSAFRVVGAETLIFNNNMVLNNYAEFTSSGSLSVTNGSGIYFSNNTVINNDSFDDDRAHVLLYLGGGNVNVLAANNILTGNDDNDLWVSNLGTGNYYLFNNNINELGGSTPTQALNNINVPNQFESGPLLHYVPGIDSSLVDAGVNPCLSQCSDPFLQNWLMETLDVVNQQRPKGFKPDIGAFESDYSDEVIFENTFE
jgi:hypothetical protein